MLILILYTVIYLPDEIVGIREHPTEFNSWSLESCWDIATFTRQENVHRTRNTTKIENQ